MARTALWASMAFLALGLVTTVLLRAELATPGIDLPWEVTTARGAGHAYALVVALHGASGGLASALVGLFLCATARDAGIAAARVGVALSVLCLLALVLAIAAPLAWPLVFGTPGVGPDMSDRSADSLAGPLAPLVRAMDGGLSVMLGAWPVLMGLPLIAAATGARRWSVLVFGGAVAAGVFSLVELGRAVFSADGPSTLGLLEAGATFAGLSAVLLFILLVILAARLIEEDDAPAPYLTTVAAFTVALWITTTGTGRAPGDAFLADTYFRVGRDHLLAYLLPLFGLFAGLLVWWRSAVRPLVLWIHAGLLAAGALAVFMPQLFLGRMGMPRRYIDYPEAFGFWNLVSSLATLALVLIALAGLWLIWRRRAR